MARMAMAWCFEKPARHGSNSRLQKPRSGNCQRGGGKLAGRLTSMRAVIQRVFGGSLTIAGQVKGL